MTLMTCLKNTADGQDSDRREPTGRPCCICRMTYRQIAHEFNMSKYTISKQLDLAISSFRISYEAQQHEAKH